MPLFEIDPWKLVERGFHPDQMRLSESLTSIGNGWMGMRGNFEEKYSGDSHRGTYLGGVWFPDKTRVGWWKNGYPKYFGKVINAINMAGIDITVDGVEIDLAKLPVLGFERELDMETGALRRRVTVRHPKGEIRFECERFLSIVDRRVMAIRFRVTPSFSCEVAMTPYLNGNVKNEDANYEELFWEMLDQGQAEDCGYVTVKTRENPFSVPRFAACAAMHAVYAGATVTKWEVKPGYTGMRLSKRVLTGRSAELEKLVAVVTTRDYEEPELKKRALAALTAARAKGYPWLYKEHAAAWRERWDGADVTIDGDDAAQQGIRFNIFQLFCTYDGSDARLNIGPKGFTGEKYGGATYWDTEAYCLPMYLSIAPEEVAKNLLIYRYRQLPGAFHNAKEQGLEGALYPMVTFNGIECHNEWEITFEEIHRNAAIAHAIFQYETYTGDKDYVKDYGFDVILAIARFWASRVHFSKRAGKYMIHGVTGPNEYENNVEQQLVHQPHGRLVPFLRRGDREVRQIPLGGTEPDRGGSEELREDRWEPVPAGGQRAGRVRGPRHVPGQGFETRRLDRPGRPADQPALVLGPDPALLLHQAGGHAAGAVRAGPPVRPRDQEAQLRLLRADDGPRVQPVAPACTRSWRRRSATSTRRWRCTTAPRAWTWTT